MKSAFIFLASCMAPLVYPVASTSPSESSTSSCPVSFDAIPQELMGLVAQATGTQGVAALSSTSKEWNQICKDILADRRHFGDIPTFLPAMRLCMIEDNVECYDAVMRQFQRQNRENPWRLAQLPALAVQWDASKIFFQRLKVNQDDPRWHSWMTRAMAKDSLHVLQDARLDPPYPRPPSRKQSQQTTTRSTRNIDSTKYVLKGWASLLRNPPAVLPPLRVSKTVFSVPREEEAMYPWINHTALNNQSAYPTYETILSVLELENVNERRQHISALKTRIKHVLSKGIFLVHDMLVDSEMTFLLWSRYVDDKKNSTVNRQDAAVAAASSSSRSSASNTTTVSNTQDDVDDDGGRSEFFQWLLDEGAPMTAEAHISSLSVGLDPLIREKYKRWIKLCTHYVYRSGTDALIGFFRKDPTQMKYHKYYLFFFNTFVGANVNHPTWLKEMLDSGYGYFRSQGIEYMVENGLSVGDVQALRVYGATLPVSRDESINKARSRLIDEMEYLTRKQKLKKQVSYPADWVKSWISIFI